MELRILSFNAVHLLCVGFLGLAFGGAILYNHVVALGAWIEMKVRVLATEQGNGERRYGFSPFLLPQGALTLNFSISLQMGSVNIFLVESKGIIIPSKEMPLS